MPHISVQSCTLITAPTRLAVPQPHLHGAPLNILPNTGDTKKWELLKNPTKIEEIQEKKFIDRN